MNNAYVVFNIFKRMNLPRDYKGSKNEFNPLNLCVSVPLWQAY